MNKNYKLIVSDFDGTLVDRGVEVTPQVTQAVSSWINAGKLFSIATGRQFLMIKSECERLGLTNPVVVRGGSEIVDPQTGRVIYSSYMKQESVERLINLLRSKGFKISIELGDTYYTDFYYSSKFEGVLKFEAVENFTLQDIPKIIATCELDSPLYQEMHEVVKEFPELHIVQVKLHNAIGWDITAANATKHVGVLELMRILDTKPEESVGVGDDYNDFPLLEACGLKVAMGNAVEDLKGIADLIVPTEKENGIAFLINKLLQDEK